MVSKDDNKIVIWPEYFDNAVSKSAGRRVSRKLAISSPNVEEIAKAAKKLKLNPKIERNKIYPGRWWRKSGRVLVQPKEKKTKIIKRLAIVIKKGKK
jgi:signal recognition particle subunit SRP19